MHGRNGFAVRCVKDEIALCFDPDVDSVCAEDEVSGCTDSSATNFNSTATEDDGSCLYGPAQCGGASTVTFDDYTYALVGIGTQCWFKENLRSDNYRNGDVIPGNLTASDWMSMSSGAQAIYNNDLSNLTNYGRLYNWHAVNDTRGLCPVGFHVPSDGEWSVLESALGGSSVAGAALKSASADSPSWNGTNSSGFSALPGGYIYIATGDFYGIGNHGYWWSSSLVAPFAWFRYLYSDNPYIERNNYYQGSGFSIRCIRD